MRKCIWRYAAMPATGFERGTGVSSQVPLYGMAACQRCLEEFDALLELAHFTSPVWHNTRRFCDISRVANMLLATGPPFGSLTWSSAGVL
jgi:hypothetical protein